MKRIARITVIWGILILLIIGTQLLGGVYKENESVPLIWMFLSFIILIGFLLRLQKKIVINNRSFIFETSTWFSILAILYFLTITITILIQPFINATPIEILQKSLYYILPFEGILLILIYSRLNIEQTDLSKLKKEIQGQKPIKKYNWQLSSAEKRTLKTLVGEGNLSIVFEQLESLLQSKKVKDYDDLLTLKARYKKINEDQADNVVSNEYVSREVSKVTKELLEMIRNSVNEIP